jgi:hypothetical protein
MGSLLETCGSFLRLYHKLSPGKPPCLHISLTFTFTN